MINETIKRKIFKEVTAGTAGGVSPMMAVAVAGQPGVSAVGLTTGLAALGFGSMFLGVGVVAVIGIGTYTIIKAIIEDEGDA